MTSDPGRPIEMEEVGINLAFALVELLGELAHALRTGEEQAEELLPDSLGCFL